LAGENFGDFRQLAASCRFEVDRYGLADILERRFDGFALRHAARELRNVGDVAAVFGVKNQVDEEAFFLAHGGIVQQNIFEVAEGWCGGGWGG